MPLTKVSPSLFQVSNNITSTTVGGSANTISLTFDSNGVITGASNNVLSVANTLITGNIVSSQITSVANTQITGNIASSQIAPSVTLYGNPTVTGNLNLDSTATSKLYLPSTNTVAIQTANTTAVYVDSSQNVGIGTTSPAKRFHVYKTGDGQTPIRFETNNVSGNILDIYNDSNGWTLDSYGDLRLITGRTGSGSPERLSISSTGRVGIGTSPTTGNTLKVFNLSGDNPVQFGNPSNGVYLPNGSSSWSTYSDLRLKTVIGTYDNPLIDIEKIDVIKFTWKHDTENKPQVGVSAQSVQLSVPEAMHQSTLPNDDEDKTEYLTVKYTELIPLMIASIKELKALTDTQATTIAELTARVAALESK